MFLRFVPPPMRASATIGCASNSHGLNLWFDLASNTLRQTRSDLRKRDE
jgi:hypothetical protein